MTYNQAFQTASEIFLTEPVPAKFLALDPKAQNKWLVDHVWEPLENTSPQALYELIDSAAKAIVRAQKGGPNLATLGCGTQASRDEYLRLHGQKEAINQSLNSIDNRAMESVVLPVSLKYIHLTVLDIVEILYKQLEEVRELIEEVEHTTEFRAWEC